MKIELREKMLSSAAYLFGVPALYIILTEMRKKEYAGYHGRQAFLLWAAFIVIFFGLRLLVNLVWSFYYVPYLDLLEAAAAGGMGIYAFYCAYRAFSGIEFKIPH